FNCDREKLQLPLHFILSYVTTQGYVVLSVPNGRSWYAELRITPPSSSNRVARLCHGWPEFSNDNNLEFGDVCVFKLLDKPEISFEVSIVRFAEWSRGQYATRLSGGTINDETGEPSSLDGFPAKEASGCMSIPSKTSQRPWTATEKARILDSIPFESEGPFCKVLMQRTYVGFNCKIVQLPIQFVMRYIKTQGHVILSVPNGRSWNAKLRITPPDGPNCEARLCKGWREFANDNNLKAGDVCIFKLLDRPEISFEVSIVSFAEWSKGEYATRLSGGTINDEIGEPGSLDSFPAKQASGCMFTPGKRRQCPLTYTEKARILDSIPFESERPFFKVLMQPTNAGFKCKQLQLPIQFVLRYVKTQCHVILSVPNGRSWNAELRITPPAGPKCEARLYKGWREFANDNNLKVGDVCIFKLLDRPEISFEVSIVRSAEHDSFRGSQDKL
ncbi:B3 DNA binding domain containing protein, partial [Trema orientale]